MTKTKTVHAYELELRRLIKERTGAECEVWLYPQINATAMNRVLLDKMQQEIIKNTNLVTTTAGVNGQAKYGVSPLLPHYDKLQRTLLMQYEAIGLNYTVTPSKVKEDTRRGIDEADPMAQYYTSTRK
jgi:hypothetical protein